MTASLPIVCEPRLDLEAPDLPGLELDLEVVVDDFARIPPGEPDGGHDEPGPDPTLKAQPLTQDHPGGGDAKSGLCRQDDGRGGCSEHRLRPDLE